MATETVNDVYGPVTVSTSNAQFWFRKFRSGNFDVKYAPRVGRPFVENSDKIVELTEADRHVSSHSIAQELNIDHKTVLRHLQNARFSKMLDIWVPQKKHTGPNFHL